MAGSFGMSGNKSSNNNSFDQNVWGAQEGPLKDLYAQAGNLFNSINSQMSGAMNGATNYMNQTAGDANSAWQNQLKGGAYQNMDLQNNLMNSLNSSMNKPSATSQINAMTMGGDGNNYADAMKGQYMQDANDAQKMMLANTDARAAASGMSGGSRHGIVQSQGMADINKNLQSNLARTGYETFDKDLDRKLGIAQQADQSNLARQQMMQNMLGQQNQSMQGAIGQGGNMQNLGMGQFGAMMMPQNAMSNYSNVIGAPQVLSSGSSYGKSKGAGMSGSGGKG
jgi:hypothetical protein